LYPLGLAVIVEGQANALAIKNLPISSAAYMGTESTSYCKTGDTVTALNDLIDPVWSYDESLPRLTWYPHQGTAEWVQYDFTEDYVVDGVEVFWVDDTPPTYGFDHLPYDMYRGPATWSVEYREGGMWFPVTGSTPYEIELNQFNRVTFDRVVTNGLRIQVQLQPGYSGGIFEWRVLDEGPACAQVSASDLNHDCEIDFLDLQIMVENWLMDNRP
jgi:hypothetical protein